MFNGDFMTVEQLKDFIDSLGQKALPADVYFKDEENTEFTVDLAEVIIGSDGEASFILR